MRKLLVGALMGVLALAVTAIAVAESEQSGTTTQNYSQTYSAKKGKTATGTTFETSSTNSANDEQNKQPKRVTNFDIKFPVGSKIDSKAAPQCKADENDFAAEDDPDDACPKGSKIGSGAVKARLPYNNTSELNGTVTAYNANKGLLLWVQVSASGATQSLLIKPKFSGLNLKTKVPVTCLPPNTPQNGCKDSSGQEQAVVLTSFNLKTKAVSSGKGKKRRQLITTPPACTSKGWQFVASLKYSDGSGVKIPVTQKC
jgi:uncharacterized low-complexity protein